MKKFALTCDACGELNEFTTSEIDDLDDYIEGECDDAKLDEYDRGLEDGREGAELVACDKKLLTSTLIEMERARRIGDTDTVNLMIERMADELGPPAVEGVAQARCCVLHEAA